MLRNDILAKSIDHAGAVIHHLLHWRAVSVHGSHWWHWLWLQLSAEGNPRLQEGLPLPSGSTRSPSPKSRWQCVCHRYSSLSSSRQLPDTQDAAPHCRPLSFLPRPAPGVLRLRRAPNRFPTAFLLQPR